MGETTLNDVERLAGQLPLEEQINLLEYLARQVRLSLASRSPQDLRGIWRGRFPDNFDVDWMPRSRIFVTNGKVNGRRVIFSHESLRR